MKKYKIQTKEHTFVIEPNEIQEQGFKNFFWLKISLWNLFVKFQKESLNEGGRTLPWETLRGLAFRFIKEGNVPQQTEGFALRVCNEFLQRSKNKNKPPYPLKSTSTNIEFCKGVRFDDSAKMLTIPMIGSLKIKEAEFPNFNIKSTVVYNLKGVWYIRIKAIKTTMKD